MGKFYIQLLTFMKIRKIRFYNLGCTFFCRLFSQSISFKYVGLSLAHTLYFWNSWRKIQFHIRGYILCCISDKLDGKLQLTHANVYISTHDIIQWNLSADTCKDTSWHTSTCTHTRVTNRCTKPSPRASDKCSALNISAWLPPPRPPTTWDLTSSTIHRWNSGSHLWPTHVQVMAGAVIMCWLANTVHNHLRIQRDTIRDGRRKSLVSQYGRASAASIDWTHVVRLHRRRCAWHVS